MQATVIRPLGGPIPTPPPPITMTFAALALGTTAGPAALCVLQRLILDPPLTKLPAYGLTWLERFAAGTSYQKIGAEVAKRLTAPALSQTCVRLTLDTT